MMDLEEELMDLASNELAYLPPSTTVDTSRRSWSSHSPVHATSRLAEQVAEQLLAQATRQMELQRDEQQQSEAVKYRKSTDEELLSEEQKQFLAEEDVRQERRNAVMRELTSSRKEQIQTRLDDLVLQFENRQQLLVDRVAADGGDEGTRRRLVMMEQMNAKLDFVVELSTLELKLALQENSGAGVKWTRLLKELPVEERDYLARAADERFVEQMKYLKGVRENQREGAIEQHLHDILVLTAPHHNGQKLAKTSVHHSLRHLLQAFANVFRGCYAGFLQYGGQGFGLRRGLSVDRVTCTLPLVAADVTQFAAILAQVVLFKYPFLQTSAPQRMAVQRSVLAALFGALQPALHGLYVASFQREDAIMNDLAEVSRTCPLEFFQVVPLFRLDGSWPERQQLTCDGNERQQLTGDGNERRLMALRHYNAAIHHMNNLASDRSPFAKLERLSHVCREVDRGIKAFYELQPAESRPSPEQLNIAADDLCALLSFILVSAPSSCLHIYTQLALLGSFTPESLASGPEGYALTTCMAAVRHLMQLQ